MRTWLPTYARLDRRTVNLVSALLLSGSIALAIVWFFKDAWPARYEPLVELFGFGGGFLGLFVDQRIEAAERREQSLAALEIELRDNLDLLSGPRFAEPEYSKAPRTYPTLRVVAVNAAMLSGVLGSPRDADLATDIGNWHTAVTELNHATRLTEMITFINPDLAESFALVLHEPDSVLSDAHTAAKRLLSTLSDRQDRP